MNKCGPSWRRSRRRGMKYVRLSALTVKMYRAGESLAIGGAARRRADDGEAE